MLPRLIIDRYSGNNPSRSDPRPVNLIRLIQDYGLVGTWDKASMQQSQDPWQWHIAESDLALFYMDTLGTNWFQGLYHWVDPIGNWQGQAEHFLRAIDAVEPDGIGFDIEQYRSSWTKAWTVMSKQRIYDATVFIVEFVKARRPDVPRAPYSAKWFLEKYCPALVDYFGNDAAWVASYLDYGQKVRAVTKGQFLDFAKLAKETPMPTSGIGVLKNPIVRQITSSQILPVCSANYDFSVILDDAQFDAWAGWPHEVR
jgi:hypothetical protein